MFKNLVLFDKRCDYTTNFRIQEIGLKNTIESFLKIHKWFLGHPKVIHVQVVDYIARIFLSLGENLTGAKNSLPKVYNTLTLKRTPI